MIRWLFLDPTSRLRTAWRFLIFGLSFLVIVGGANIVVGLVFLIYLMVANTNLNAANSEQMAGLIDEYTPILSALAAPPLTTLSTLLVILCRKFLDQRSVVSLGLAPPDRRAWAWLPVAFLLGVTPILVGTFCMWSAGEYLMGSWSGTIMTAIMIPTLLLMAFHEEIVARGYLLQNLLDIRRPVLGVVFSSLVFWLFHSLNPHAWSSPWIGINLFGAGVVLALAYMASGNLWFPTVMHFAWNFTQGVLLSLPISGVETPGMIAVEETGVLPEWLSGGGFGLEGSVIVTAAEVVLAIGFGCALVSKQRRAATLAEAPIDAVCVPEPNIVSDAGAEA